MTGGKVDLSFLIPKFLERLNERLRRIEDGVTAAVNQAGEPLDVLMREFHSMAGIGGTYGFPEVTRLALEGEALIRHALFEARVLRTTEIDTIKGLVSQLDAIRLSSLQELSRTTASGPTPEKNQQA